MLYFLIFIAAAVLTLLGGKLILPLLIRLKVGQTIRAEGPQKHFAKAGTPTMGGVFFILAAFLTAAVFCSGSSLFWIWLFGFLAFAIIGGADDMFKVALHRNLGLTVKQKFAAQFAAIAIVLLMSERLLGRGTVLYFGPQLPLLDLGWCYYPLMALFLVYFINAVNLTDGLDGLAAGVSFIVFIGVAVIGVGAAAFSSVYADLPLIALAMAGAMLGFLYYNSHPARVFMGDTGSLAIGGAIAALAAAAGLEIIIIGFGVVFIVEALSVVLQVLYFKLTKGKRLFLMSPLHHHFELKGWKETKVTAVFWLLSAAGVCLTLIVSAIV
ncbi:MAG: phospho-N-acetylmuramoyl-pentapeptide-transferase [Bacillota bacterium]|nr:phospho-N-acetylmuramoyl-pentapeptide-transferase [Bacillota bacterium]